MEGAPLSQEDSLLKVHPEASSSEFKTHFPTRTLFLCYWITTEVLQYQKERDACIAIVQKKMLPSKKKKKVQLKVLTEKIINKILREEVTFKSHLQWEKKERAFQVEGLVVQRQGIFNSLWQRVRMDRESSAGLSEVRVGLWMP